MGIFDKVKEQVAGYKDSDSGKTGFSGLASDGEAAYKNYQTDAKDGSVDWKKEGTDVFGQLKQGFGGSGAATGSATGATTATGDAATAATDAAGGAGGAAPPA